MINDKSRRIDRAATYDIPNGGGGRWRAVELKMPRDREGLLATEKHLQLGAAKGGRRRCCSGLVVEMGQREQNKIETSTGFRFRSVPGVFAFSEAMYSDFKGSESGKPSRNNQTNSRNVSKWLLLPCPTWHRIPFSLRNGRARAVPQFPFILFFSAFRARTNSLPFLSRMHAVVR